MRGKLSDQPECRCGRRITPAHAGKTRLKKQNLLRPPDHPRACGENCCHSRLSSGSSGSSPRMRGKRLQLLHQLLVFRITPAHAGKTQKTFSFSTRRADHPRACGENPESGIPKLSNVGSPPRMRGKRDPALEGFSLRRITPAHAGKTLPVKNPLPQHPDHPRACGENSTATTCRTPVSGSPPRMRGKPLCGGMATAQHRITPAHAGKTRCSRTGRSQGADHPRACGENLRPFAASSPSFGSPPRMRGKPQGKIYQSGGARITPAHAGKTGVLVKKTRGRTDHPRACGENSASCSLRPNSFGSPPRMRGKLRSSDETPPPPRITPAHAGKTYFQKLKTRRGPDHPRACGENSPSSTISTAGRGSPPRMRGKPEVAALPPSARRITPAHAGKTVHARPAYMPPADHPRACGENPSQALRIVSPRGSPPRMRGKLRACLFQYLFLRITPAHAGKTAQSHRGP